jgi:hypothetical protein
MSPLGGWLTPAARAALEAVLAKLAAPGMANPYDENPVLDATPVDDAVCRDTRSPTQRNHDALHAALRGVLASGKLGQHNGLPTTIIVTTTLQDLEAGAGRGLTGGGSLLPMKDVIRLARHAHHYLAIFDKSRAIGLYHTKRLASPGQRIVLYAKDRGCSHPGCEVPGYLRSPSCDPLCHLPPDRCQRAGLWLRRPPSAGRTRRLDDPQAGQRRHRVAPPASPGSRPTPHQHLPPPRKTPRR